MNNTFKRTLGNVGVKAMLEQVPSLTKDGMTKVAHYTYYRLKNTKDRDFYKIKKELQGDGK